jgi:serine/threonine protein kinase
MFKQETESTAGSHLSNHASDQTEGTDFNNITISINIPYSDLKIGKFLGKGGCGVVYKGQYLNEKVAIKSFFFNSTDPVLLELFQREVKVMANIRHENIVAFRGACLEERHYALVMEYMPKGALSNVLKNESLAWDIKCRIGQDTAKGLNYLHHHGIVHRDVKTDNVLLDENYKAKIADFGLSKFKSEHSTFGRWEGEGSYRWMAPEVFKTEQNTKEADVYSFGLILWSLGTGDMPFKDVRMEVIGHIKAGNKEEVSADTPETLRVVIHQCWDEPEKRPAMTQVVETLTQGYLAYLAFLPSAVESHSKEKEKEKGKEKEKEWEPESHAKDLESSVVANQRRGSNINPNFFPLSEEGLLAKAKAYMDEKKYFDSMTCWNQLIDMSPRKPDYRFSRAIALVRLGRREDAIADFTQVIRFAPEHIQSWVERGFTLENMQKIEDALGDYNEALRLNPQHYFALIRRGGLLMQRGQVEKGETDFIAALEIRDDDAALYQRRGEGYLHLERYPEAIADFDEVLRLHPEYKDVEAMKLEAQRQLETKKEEQPKRFLGLF